MEEKSNTWLTEFAELCQGLEISPQEAVKSLRNVVSRRQIIGGAAALGGLVAMSGSAMASTDSGTLSCFQIEAEQIGSDTQAQILDVSNHYADFSNRDMLRLPLSAGTPASGFTSTGLVVYDTDAD